MNFLPRFRPSAVSALAYLTCGAAALALSVTASAQDPSPEGSTTTAAADDTATIVVTGSRIKRVINEEGPAPVQTVTREDIEKLGYTSVTDVLGDLAVNAGGSFDAGQSFSFARGTTSIDLRGFGAGRTLILLDGRRLPVFPQGLGGTDAFVDLSSIPVSTIERVEVLLDGASAIYGSDAISGVVNIITRKNVQGTELSARWLDSEDRGGSQARFQFLQGLVAGETSVQIIGEYINQNVLKFTDRSFSESDFGNGGNGSGFGNTFFATDFATPLAIDPNCGVAGGALDGRGVVVGPVCRFDRSEYRQWIPEQDKGSLTIRMDRKIGEYNGYARIGAYRSKQEFELEPNAYSGGESAAFTQNRIIPNSAFDPMFGPGYVAAGAVNNPTTGTGNEQGGYFFRRLTEFGPRGAETTSQAYTGLVGIEGEWRDYSWDIGIAHNEVRFEANTPTILSSVLDNEVSNNGLNLFDRIPDSIVAKASHDQYEKATSRNTAVDGTVTGPIPISLPGGKIQFAVHGEFEKQRYKDAFDAISTQGDVFDGGNGGGGKREYSGLGAEFMLPILDGLEFTVASRMDSYSDESDTGSAFSPSFRLGYRPIEQLLLRASWGESFRAPDLQRLFGATANGFETVIDSPRCVAAGGSPGTPLDPANANDICLPIQSVPTADGSNPDLKEESGENFNVGVVYEVIRDLTFEVNYYKIQIDDIVSSLTAQQILDLCASTGSFCGQIQRNPNTGLLGTPSGGGDNSSLISSGAVNLASQEVDGFDVAATYIFKMDGFGRFRNEFNWSHVRSLKVKSQPGDPNVEQIGFGQTILLPENRYTFETDWELLQYGLTMRINRIGKYPGSNALTEPATSDQFVDPYTTVDVQGRVDFGKYGLVRLGIDNLLDKNFPHDPTFEDAGGANVQNQYLGEGSSFYASPLGRAGYVQYEIKFK